MSKKSKRRKEKLKASKRPEIIKPESKLPVFWRDKYNLNCSSPNKLQPFMTEFNVAWIVKVDGMMMNLVTHLPCHKTPMTGQHAKEDAQSRTDCPKQKNNDS